MNRKKLSTSLLSLFYLAKEKVSFVDCSRNETRFEKNTHLLPFTFHFSLLICRTILLAILSFSQIAATFPWDYVKKNNEGVKKYFNKEYREAELLFRKAQIADSSSYKIKYNLADSLYKQGKFFEAQNILLDLLKETELDATLKQKIFYNLGNIFYRMGEQKNPQMYWINALKQYESALALDTEDKKARENYDFVKKKLEKLNKQNQSGNKGKNKTEQPDGKDDGKTPSAYSNSPSEPYEKKIYSVTKSETEDILNELKLQEDSMQKFINRRQLKSNKSNDKEQNPYLKDW